MLSLLTLGDVSVTTDSGVTLLKKVNLTIKPRQIISLIGPNGAGKSTLIRVLAALQPPATGSIERQPNLVTGYLPQRLTLPMNLPITAGEFLRLGLNRHQPNTELHTTGVTHLIDKPLQALSGGELRRLLLARALIRRPKLLLLDEPTAGVDLIGQVEFYQLLAKVRDEYGCAIVIVSHDLHFVMAATDQVLCLDQGLVCCHGHPEEVSQHPEYRSLFGAGTEQAFAVFTHAMGGHNHAHAHGGDHIDAVEPVHTDHG